MSKLLCVNKGFSFTQALQCLFLFRESLHFDCQITIIKLIFQPMVGATSLTNLTLR